MIRIEHRWIWLVVAAANAAAMGCGPPAPVSLLAAAPSAASAPSVAYTSPPRLDAAALAQAGGISVSTGKPAPALGPLEIEERSLAERLRAPLVSDDGKQIATGMFVESTEEDRFMLLRVRDVDSDREVQSLADQPDATVDQKLALFATVSAALDAQKWSLLTKYDTAIDPTAKERSHALGTAVPRMGTGEGLRVRFHEPMFIVEETGGHPLFRRAFPGWSNKGPVAGQSCVTYADLADVWASRTRGVLVVKIGYSGSPHFCSFAAELHVVRFARP